MRTARAASVLFALFCACGSDRPAAGNNVSASEEHKLFARTIELYQELSDAVVAAPDCQRTSLAVQAWKSTRGAELAQLSAAGARLSPLPRGILDDKQRVHFQQLQVSIATQLHKCEDAARDFQLAPP